MIVYKTGIAVTCFNTSEVELPFKPGGVLDVVGNLRVKFFPDPRRAEYIGRADLLQVFVNRIDALCKIDRVARYDRFKKG